jgi:hypothetical protein
MTICIDQYITSITATTTHPTHHFDVDERRWRGNSATSLHIQPPPLIPPSILTKTWQQCHITPRTATTTLPPPFLCDDVAPSHVTQPPAVPHHSAGHHYSRHPTTKLMSDSDGTRCFFNNFFFHYQQFSIVYCISSLNIIFFIIFHMNHISLLVTKKKISNEIFCWMWWWVWDWARQW